MDIARRILRPEPKLGKDGPTITYGLLTVEDRSRAMQFASGSAPRPVKGAKRVRPQKLEPVPDATIDQDLYGRAVAALVLRSVEGAEVDGDALTWTCGLPMDQMVERLEIWPLRWLLKLIRVSTEDSELDPEEE
jgi:hypothetical protein